MADGPQTPQAGETQPAVPSEPAAAVPDATAATAAPVAAGPAEAAPAATASTEADLADAIGAPAAAAPAQAEDGHEPAVIGSPIASLQADAALPIAVPDLAASAARPALAPIDLLDDVELDVKIELGRAQMYIEDVLRLGEGSVVELDKLAGDPVDVFVNDNLVARGEVLVLNENFCVRINDIISPTEDGESEE